MYACMYICRRHDGTLTLAAKCERPRAQFAFAMFLRQGIRGRERKRERKRERETLLEEADNALSPGETRLSDLMDSSSRRCTPACSPSILSAYVICLVFEYDRQPGWQQREKKRETRNERERKEMRIRDA